MEKSPFISIAIAAYNCEKYIQKAVKCIINQNFKDYEIIIVNDGSTDSTSSEIMNIIEEHQDIRIIYINKENGGAASARNCALEVANGKYIMFHDGDDYLTPNGLQELVSVAQSTNADRIYSELQLVDENGKILEVQHFPDYPSKWTISTSAASLFKRSVFVDNEIRWVEGMYSEDIYINFLFSQYCRTVEYVYVPTYNWVQHKDSTSSPDNSNSLKGKEMMQEIIDNCKDIYLKLENNDKLLMEYEMIKMYIIAVLRSLRNYSYNDMITEYKSLHTYFIGCFRNYYNNPYINRKKKNPIRNKTRIIIKCFIKIEKLNLMSVFLLVYKLICKIHRFSF
ncbi:MAG: glycosyltransferase [Lachnospiraceae bacterium]|nr:glycosyltransferase [Lachnospiraceae bacterium]